MLWLQFTVSLIRNRTSPSHPTTSKSGFKSALHQTIRTRILICHHSTAFRRYQRHLNLCSQIHSSWPRYIEGQPWKPQQILIHLSIPFSNISFIYSHANLANPLCLKHQSTTRTRALINRQFTEPTPQKPSTTLTSVYRFTPPCQNITKVNCWIMEPNNSIKYCSNSTHHNMTFNPRKHTKKSVQHK